MSVNLLSKSAANANNTVTSFSTYKLSIIFRVVTTYRQSIVSAFK